jgi:hypothetical protein
MSLHLPTPPAAAVRVVRAALDSPTARHASRIPALQVAPSRLTADQALEIHRIDLGTGNQRGTAAPLARLARPIGWRFIVRRDGEAAPLAAAETMETADGTAFRHFCCGPFVAAALRAVQQAQALPAARGARFEPRLLSVPDLYMMALWLHAGTAEEDLLVPLAPAPPGFLTHRPHRAAVLLPVLADRAALRMLAGTA